MVKHLIGTKVAFFYERGEGLVKWVDLLKFKFIESTGAKKGNIKYIGVFDFETCSTGNPAEGDVVYATAWQANPELSFKVRTDLTPEEKEHDELWAKRTAEKKNPHKIRNYTLKPRQTSEPRVRVAKNLEEARTSVLDMVHDMCEQGMWGMTFYAHNLAKFDGVFLLRVITEYTEKYKEKK